MIFYVILFIVCFILKFYFTKNLINILKRKHILDHPELRSNHKIPTPRGGGIATVIIFSCLLPLSYYLLYSNLNKEIIFFTLIIVLIGIISFNDDIKHIGQLWRLFVHFLAVIVMIYVLPIENSHNLILLEGQSFFWDRFLLIVFGVYFINIYNFMDGIDGITAANNICMASAILVGTFLYNINDHFLSISAIIIISTSLAFMFFNWCPAKIFYGDVGSVTNGAIIFYLLLKFSTYNVIFHPLLFAFYYLADSTITLFRRMIAGEKIWNPHSKHFYQLAVRNGYSHQQVVIFIILINIIMTVIAFNYAPTGSFSIMQYFVQ
jgi:UDP-N-acetylmuramyl pentapeptide phosphotransferase/UDP-N-acetylglucosamine-1-phosphate transferase